jgi:hypothetical protein
MRGVPLPRLPGALALERHGALLSVQVDVAAVMLEVVVEDSTGAVQALVFELKINHRKLVGREAIEGYITDLFQRHNPSDRVTKMSYVYAFGGDLCALGGWTVTIDGSRKIWRLSCNCIYLRRWYLEDSYVGL